MFTVYPLKGTYICRWSDSSRGGGRTILPKVFGVFLIFGHRLC